MALPQEEVEKIRKVLMSYFGVAGNLTKPMAREAINVTDSWIDDDAEKPAGISNQQSYINYLATNAADFTDNSNPIQKSILFAFVLLQRAGLIDKVR